MNQTKPKQQQQQNEKRPNDDIYIEIHYIKRIKRYILYQTISMLHFLIYEMVWGKEFNLIMQNFWFKNEKKCNQLKLQNYIK